MDNNNLYYNDDYITLDPFLKTMLPMHNHQMFIGHPVYTGDKPAIGVSELIFDSSHLNLSQHKQSVVGLFLVQKFASCKINISSKGQDVGLREV